MQAPIPLSRLVLIWIIASVAVAIAGPFGTIAFPIELRLPYWFGLIAVNMVKWTLWFRIGGHFLGWRPRAMMILALTGVVVVNLPLPLEVWVANQAVGGSGSLPYWAIYSSAAAMGLTATAGIAALRWLRQADRHAARVTAQEADPIAEEGCATALSLDMPTGSLLTRAGVADAGQVMAVEAEDHYLRLHLTDGRKPLVLYRLRDALSELSHLDGEQVHRGYWVAGRAVRGLERREGRKWALRLECGLLVPVSATFMPMVRKRGWQELSPALER